MTADLSRALAPGERFGRYEIVGVLARGGRSFVYRALDDADRPVALKIATARHTEDELERLRRDLAATALVDHPNLERTVECGIADGRAWYATEIVPGQSLETHLATHGPLETERAVAVGTQIARGLQALHARGLLYRNLKPSNVMLLDDGAVKILDVVASVTARKDRPLSTPQTMSPEEFSGAELDARADVYSLGALLFQLVTGRPPFDGTQDDLRDGHLHRPAPRLRAVKPSAAALEAVINQALEKRPAKRFESMEAMATALEGAGR